MCIRDSYNTYEIVGLPPGAIDNPGMMAINAVLNPDTTDNYLYFCHSADGTPYYAYTAEGHYENQDVYKRQGVS